MTPTDRLRLAPLVLVALGLAAGCGESTTVVAGTVTMQGKPLTGGSVTLFASDGQVHSGPIGPDGKYTIAGVRSGALKIGVIGPKAVDQERAKVAGNRGGGGAAGSRGSGPPAGAQKEEAPPTPIIPIPPGPKVPGTYSDPQSSGLTGNADGKPLDIDLK